MRGLFEAADAKHQLRYLQATDETCKLRLRHRNAAGTHDYQVSEAEFELLTKFFVPPAPEEGFAVTSHQPH